MGDPKNHLKVALMVTWTGDRKELQQYQRLVELSVEQMVRMTVHQVLLKKGKFPVVLNPKEVQP